MRWQWDACNHCNRTSQLQNTFIALLSVCSSRSQDRESRGDFLPPHHPNTSLLALRLNLNKCRRVRQVGLKAPFRDEGRQPAYAPIMLPLRLSGSLPPRMAGLRIISGKTTPLQQGARDACICPRRDILVYTATRRRRRAVLSAGAGELH